VEGDSVVISYGGAESGAGHLAASGRGRRRDRRVSSGKLYQSVSEKPADELIASATPR
jgi:hypothetical protein